MMRIFRIVISVLFVISAVIFLITWGNVQLHKDDSYPVITFPDTVLEVSLHPDDAELLADVTATDQKDGDLTASLIVESISNFIEPGICNITYAVCDSDYHVVTAVRKIRYAEYTAPEFVMTDDLLYSLTEPVDLAGRLGAVDVIDGDISSRVKISSNENIVSGRTGLYQLSAQASNSKGEVIYINLPLFVEDIHPYAPEIRLKNYLVYLKQGETLDLASMVQKAFTEEKSENGEETIEIDYTGTVWYETNLDTATPGVYQADYYVIDEKDREGHAILMIVVEEEQ